MLVGNKCDLRELEVNCVPTSYGEKLAMTYNTLFCETSAKEGSNILEAVLHLARQVKEQSTLNRKSHYQSLPSLDAPQKHKSELQKMDIATLKRQNTALVNKNDELMAKLKMAEAQIHKNFIGINVFTQQTYNTLFCETSAKEGSNILA
ncbi:unnamed protein product [Pleuronectes platessa]|uniref:Uncharacterized protein n=1 Tax=Pleuronectes platessa TaxID=8262 RepID=A0A9N7U2L0_PLEPL|nr:unnamed protein product [Pleuronectes platessa]